MANLRLEHQTHPVTWTSSASHDQPTVSDGLRLLHLLTAPALLINGDRQIIEVNAAAEATLELDAMGIINKLVQQTPVTKTLTQSGAVAELDLGENAARRYLELCVVYVDSRDGSLVAILHDIGKRKRAEEAQSTLVESLESYASTVAHDLKAPLGTILGFAALLEMDSPELTDDQRKYLHIIQMTGNKMSKMIDDILLAATVHSLEQVPVARIDLLAVIRPVLDRLTGMINEFEAEIEVVNYLPPCLGYAPWVEEILANYISNAVKYGGAPPRVEIGADANSDTVRYWVRDNGVGLTPENRDMLFKKTARFDSRQRGHGLGLTIVQRIVERLGGEAGVESDLGSGSTFYFTLPRA
ncbi:MAG: HAMP domain-containing histidine kinase [Anaerolineae bacterium]|nr:HAMP domain-containing histidine kinase [Anaerolineae bacterium]